MVVAAVSMVVGLVILSYGADVFVRGAGGLALSAGISPLVVGLTVVAFGTSAPEMVVSVLAAIEGEADIALGNVLGSNAFNLLFILGACALIQTLVVAPELLRFDLPVMVASGLMAGAVCWDGTLTHLDGALLLGSLAAYLGRHLRVARRASEGVPPALSNEDQPGRGKLTLLLLGGLVGLVAGSKLLVDGAVAVATALGVSELVIGLTLVAAGTSLPEVATSVVATVRGERDIAVGNVVGSNIFNVFAVLGSASFFGPGDTAVAPAAIGFDIPVMVIVTVVTAVMLWTGRQLTRIEGGLLMTGYVGYTSWLVFAA